jgi:hypothetical protein
VDGLPHFVRPKPAQPHAHIAWCCDAGEEDRPINIVSKRIMYDAQILNMPEEGWVHYVQASQLEGVLKDVEALMIEGPCVEIEALLRVAADNGEAVIMRELTRDLGQRGEYGVMEDYSDEIPDDSDESPSSCHRGMS